ncbi:hypothetical protein HPB50_009816 [Hyalomma asiaticum]|uniref:Uncharacterized protein n=1 Tax=Hyalomma asiaticum TaxID=266040 RepID=A0ACB7T9E0_HYAAI|nr:hypothetical protein HPB50_009816 [Hyalomma asiaticum]
MFRCSSYVGRIGGQQRLSLGARCANVGTVMHELMHAAGFYHEHSRSDRDEYIDIYKENIRPEKLRQFQKMHPSENRLLTPFDVHSIMMYGSSTFARVEGLITMLTKDGGYLRAVRNKRRISSSDAIRIRKLYNC